MPDPTPIAASGTAAATELPVGTVSFLFTDIEGSTRLLQQAGEAYGALLDDHRRLLRAAFASHGGREVDTQGDSFFVAFESPWRCVAAAADAQQALARHAWPPPFPVRVRMGVHTGEVRLVNGSYVGVAVHRAARIAAAGHGGQILLSDATAALVRDDLPTGAALHDLGEHRLKDFPTPARLYQLDLPGLPTTFPPLRTAGRRFDLPIPAGGTVGRESEVAAVVALLADPRTRLVTLTGPGGIGKTRLAVEAAHAVAADLAGGVVFVPLAAITDPSLVLGAVADALGARREPGQDAVASVSSALAGDRTLLVLDNLEHLVDVAGDLAGLVDRAPAAVVLATSRVPLRLRAERQFPVGALAVPDAVRLFAERATAVRPTFSADRDDAGAVAEICRRLDGLPLAIELAAARIRVLPPRALLARLGERLDVLGSGPVDLPPRQRTLRATVDWSHDLLRPHEQALFARLAVFAGGWSLEAAEVVCGRTEEPDVLDTLSALVDASLVLSDEDAAEVRFSMLETVRVYAGERLSASPDRQETCRRHAAWMLRLATELLRARGVDYRVARDRLDRELPNLRAAVQRLLDDGDVASVALLVRNASTYLRYRGLETEAGAWLDAALAMSDGAPSAVRGRLLVSRAVLASVLGDRASVPGLLSEGVLLLPEDEDHEFDQALATIPGIQVSLERGLDEGARAADAGLARFTALQLEVGEAIMHLVGGDLALARGDPEQAAAHYRSVIALSEALGEDGMLGRALSMLGLSQLELGDVHTAHRSLLEGARMNRRSGRPTSMAYSLEGLAALALAQDRPALAARNLAVAAAARGSQALPLQPVVARLMERLVERARLLLGDQAFDAEAREARSWSLPEALDRSLEDLPEPAVATGDRDQPSGSDGLPARPSS
jgi:predicted ATPase/class 3 adenylate cyclase